MKRNNVNIAIFIAVPLIVGVFLLRRYMWNSDFPVTYTDTDIGFSVNVRDEPRQTSEGGGLSTVEFGEDLITIMPIEYESLLLSGAGNPDVSDITIGDIEGTRLKGTNEKNGVSFDIYYVRNGQNIISFQGSGDFLENVQKTYQELK